MSGIFYNARRLRGDSTKKTTTPESGVSLLEGKIEEGTLIFPPPKQRSRPANEHPAKPIISWVSEVERHGKPLRLTFGA